MRDFAPSGSLGYNRRKVYLNFEMILSRSERMIKRRREILAAYVPTVPNLWHRVYPETFYVPDSFVSDHELEYIKFIYEVFRTIINGHRRTIIEDELNLMYMEIESRTVLGNFSEEVLSAIQRRLDLKKQTIQEIKNLLINAESKFPDLIKAPPNIKLRLESTIYLVRLMAYGLFSTNDIVLERVAEVFDVAKLQVNTKPKDKLEMDRTLRFLYRGLIQKNDRGRQGSRHAAKQTLATLREWYANNEYVLTCIDKIEKYV